MNSRDLGCSRHGQMSKCPTHTTQDKCLRLNLFSLNTSLHEKHPNHAQIKAPIVMYESYQQENEGFKRREVAESKQFLKLGVAESGKLLQRSTIVKPLSPQVWFHKNFKS